MVRLLYEDVECAVMDEGKESTWFKVKTGVKQGCVLSGFFVSTGDRLDNERNNKRQNDKQTGRSGLCR